MRTTSSVLKHGSQRWLQAQAADPFVADARRHGYIARSAFKLTYIDDKLGLFSQADTRVVVDLGCSPGGWCQVIRERAGDACHIFGLDLLNVKATVTNATILQGDFNDDAVKQDLRRRLEVYAAARPSMGTHSHPSSHRGGSAAAVVDVVTSDMCPNRMGGAADRHRIASLNLDALHFSLPFLKPNGHFVCKVLGSRAAFEKLHETVESHFTKALVLKPPASRIHSDEAFLIGRGKLEQPRPARRDGGGAGGGNYGLDDWPGFAHTPRMRKGRGAAEGSRVDRSRPL